MNGQHNRLRIGDPYCVGAALLVVVWLFVRIHLLTVRVFDPDEFEHLHASFCIWSGLVPYRDFFEHHGPLTYYLAAPVLIFTGAEPIALFVNRFLSLLFSLGTVAVTWSTVARLAGRPQALLAVFWLVTLPCYAEKSLEWRPDAPATFFVACAAWLLCTGESGRRAFSAGLLLGLIALCTQKGAFVIPAMVAGWIWKGRYLSGRVGWIGLLALGAAIPWAAAIAGFAIVGAGADLFRCLVWYPMNWPMEPGGEASPAMSLRSIVGQTQLAPGHYGLLAYGLVLGAWKTLRAEKRDAAPAIVGCVAHLAALPLVPAVYLQYYLLIAPLAAIAVGVAFSRTSLSESDRSPTTDETTQSDAAAKGASDRKMSLASRPALGLAIVFLAVGLWVRWPVLQSAFTQFPAMSANVYSNADLLAVLIVAAALVGTVVSRKAAWTLAWCGLFLPGVARTLAPHVYWPTNREQIEHIRFVHEVVAPDEKVLDGFSGLGCLRPHAYYFWWINHHSIPLMEQERALPPLYETVARGEPTLIVLDRDLNRLRDFLGPAIAGRYRTWKALRPDLYIMLRDDRIEELQRSDDVTPAAR